MDLPSAWMLLLDVLLLLAAALLLGLLAARLRLSPMLGAIAAGVLVGPSGLHLVAGRDAVAFLAELGVALLLFTVGLEFSLRRLRAMGMAALVGGIAQVMVTLLVVTGIAVAVGTDVAVGLVLGGIVALSSTAAVLRSFTDRGELDSVHGRLALAVLLVQDLALAPLLLLVHALGKGGSAGAIAIALGRSLVVVALLAVAFYLLASHVLPRLLTAVGGQGGRELGAILAGLTAVGSAWAAHAVGLSAALGAFLAGMLLAESPFAPQLRVDVAAWKALFMAVFFASIGMLADLGWIARHLPVFVAGVTVVVMGKWLLSTAALRISGAPLAHGAAAGLCLAQLGEFSFVLTKAGESSGLVEASLGSLLVAVLTAGFFLTPALVAAAPRVVAAAAVLRRRAASTPGESAAMHRRGLVLVVGFGPAGTGVARTARALGRDVTIVELSGKLVAAASREGFLTVLGDGSHQEVLEHAGARDASHIVVTVPDHRTAADTVRQARSLAPGAVIVARSRYRAYVEDLRSAGAQHVVDEEAEVGTLLGRFVTMGAPEGPA